MYHISMKALIVFLFLVGTASAQCSGGACSVQTRWLPSNAPQYWIIESPTPVQYRPTTTIKAAPKVAAKPTVGIGEQVLAQLKVLTEKVEKLEKENVELKLMMKAAAQKKPEPTLYYTTQPQPLYVGGVYLGNF